MCIRDSAIGDGARAQICSSGDPVWNDPMAGPMELGYSPDADSAVNVSGNISATAFEKGDQVSDLRLPGSSPQYRFPFCGSGGNEDILRCPHTGEGQGNVCLLYTSRSDPARWLP